MKGTKEEPKELPGIENIFIQRPEDVLAVEEVRHRYTEVSGGKPGVLNIEK